MEIFSRFPVGTVFNDAGVIKQRLAELEAGYR